MCYFDQVRWTCGLWKWGNFRQQCTKEYRTGETCGLKLVFDTAYKPEQCKTCDQIARKKRRIQKMENDIERWRKEGNRRATIEKTEYDIADIEAAIHSMWKIHEDKRNSL